MNIYNLKKEMKNIIYSDSSLSKNSIRDRNSAINKIFENFNNLDDVSVITKDKILDNLNSTKFKTKLSAGVNAIRFLKEHNLDFDFPSENELKEIIKNKKKNYRLAYKLMLESGLRVHEVVALKKDDFSFDKNLITINLREAKGNKLCSIELENKYLSKNISEFIETKSEDERVFPHMRYLQEQATKMGIKCHDLRRGFAKRTYKEELENDSPRSEALDKTRIKLRHTISDTTKIYLNSKIKV
ncbi:site-specific integrase [Clostridium perfringens]|uniref:Tyrosine site-specific recombinase n=1 Tax=Clostridium perfringens E str. JGS1987 TaxID=451755 RepID=B1BVU6_CLOPF|nr:site-specific integrase [Clostridium perfringens]EDT14182.1 tyrosine site-specific recombinase [Clostridium perfringens E str. JGS1987]